MAVPVRSKPERVYVNVVLSVDSTGFMKPSAIKWTDGRTFDIERIRDFRPASAAGNDINGDCYTVVIKGQDRYLFFEEANPHFSGRPGRGMKRPSPSSTAPPPRPSWPRQSCS